MPYDAKVSMGADVEVVVTMTATEFEELLERTIRRALEERPRSPVPSTLITPQEAAKLLKLSVRQVQSLCAAGELPAVQVGSRWRIRRDQLPDVSDAA